MTAQPQNHLTGDGDVNQMQVENQTLEFNNARNSGGINLGRTRVGQLQEQHGQQDAQNQNQQLRIRINHNN